MIDGAMNGEMFDLYAKTQLVPRLRPGDVVILDNINNMDRISFMKFFNH